MLIQSFINSEFSKNSNLFTKLNPFNSEPLHDVQSCELLDVVQSIQGAQKAFAEWKETALVDRVALLRKFSLILTENRKTYSQMEALDQGLPLSFVSEHGVQAAVDSIHEAISQLEDTRSTSQIYSPVGVIGLITSWNLSLRVIFERLAPALAAGNAVIVKVSSNSPVTAKILSEILLKAEAPRGLVQVLTSNRSDVKELLVTHPGVKAISFVGNLKNATDVISKLNSVSKNIFKKYQIATGSKNTAVCLDEPNDENFSKIMDSFLIGQGQLAWNSNRLFVLEKHEAAWTEKITQFLAELEPATSIDSTSMWGPCLRAESFQHFEEIEQMAIKDQAKLIQTRFQISETQKKCFLRPTFTKDMSNCSTLQQDQVAAPLFILSVVKYPFDIAKYSNVSYYGQSAHIWADESKIPKIAEQLDVAQVFKNKWSAESHMPNRGVKQSGYGLQDYRVFGDFFSNAKTLT